MKKNIHIITFCVLLLGTFNLNAQEAFDRIYDMISTAGCAEASCHNGASPSAGLDLSGNKSQVYVALVDVPPQNAVSANKGEKLVMPGYPYRSFLLRKINNGLCDELDCKLDVGEGDAMPLGGTPLTDIEVEIVRQWIIAGAPEGASDAGMFGVDVPVIEQYYATGGLPFVDRPAPPPPGKGFQIHLGPIFMPPALEKEFMKKHLVQLETPAEVNRIEVLMNQESHHFIIYKFDPSDVAGTKDGLRELGLFENPFGNELVAAWQFSSDVALPGGTAYFWDENTVIDLNYHILNYSADFIMPSEVFINVYTQPDGTALREMHSNLLLYDGILGPLFFIPAGEPDYPLTAEINNGQQWNIWLLAAHTHKYATDYDVWIRDTSMPDNKGEHIYEGTVDGYYDWSHPPTYYYENYLTLPPGTGLVHEALYYNTGPSVVGFGLTTNDEMMITFVQYTIGDPIPYVYVASEQAEYCINSSSVDLQLFPETGGTLTGNGVTGNQFNPSLAGLGTHELVYIFDGISFSHYLKVVEVPETPEITENAGVLNAQQGFVSYQWYVDGIAIDGATGLSLTPDVSGDYTVEVFDGACTVTSNAFAYDAVGIENDLTLSSAVELFPNPFSNTIGLRYELAGTEAVTVELYDLEGKRLQILYQSKQMPGSHGINLQPDFELPSGVYLLKVQLGERVITKKMLKK